MRSIPVDVIVSTSSNGYMRPTRIRYTEPQTEEKLKFDIKQILNVEETGHRTDKKIKYNCVIEDNGFNKQIVLCYLLLTTTWVLMVND